MLPRARPEGSAGILRIDFGEPDESLEEMSREAFFDNFEKPKLALLYEDDVPDRQQEPVLRVRAPD